MKKQSEFFVIIAPPRSVCQVVSDLKLFVRDAIGHDFEGHSAKAHISLFRYEDSHTESWLYDIEEQLSAHRPFHVSIKGLRAVDEDGKKTICLDIAYKQTIQDLAKRLTGHEINPRVTIAKNLTEEDFVVAWRSLRNISYSYDFTCDHVTVLKKGSGRWKTYIDLALANTKSSLYN